MNDLKDLNIILTGATGGIGSSILEKLYNHGAKIIATGTNQEKLDKISNKYENVKVKKFDISDHSSLENFINECNDDFQNKIDILINNAGITKDNLSIRMSEDEWNKVININLTSTFLFCKNTIKKMIKYKPWRNYLFKFIII